MDRNERLWFSLFKKFVIPFLQNDLQAKIWQSNVKLYYLKIFVSNIWLFEYFGKINVFVKIFAIWNYFFIEKAKFLKILTNKKFGTQIFRCNFALLGLILAFYPITPAKGTYAPLENFF